MRGGFRRNTATSRGSDVKYGPYVNGARTYLFSVIDDASRFICNSLFFAHQDQDALRETLMGAFETCGIPKVLYLDNGKIFRSHQTDYMAAVLGIRLTFIKPYTPCGHGKIERFNGTVNGFMNEIVLEKPESVEELNNFYVPWLEECYQRQPHSGLAGEKTPREAFEQDTEELRFVDGDMLRKAFLHIETRKVNKTGCISLNNEQWEIEEGSLLIGRQVRVLIDPTCPEEVTIECDGFAPSRAKKLVIRPHTGTRPHTPGADPGKVKGSRLLRDAAQRHEKRQQRERMDVLRFAPVDEKGKGTCSDSSTK